VLTRGESGDEETPRGKDAKTQESRWIKAVRRLRRRRGDEGDEGNGMDEE